MLQVLFHPLGKPFSKDTLREILKKLKVWIKAVEIKETDINWPEIGINLLGLHRLPAAFIGGIFEKIRECPQEKAELSWDKVAQTLRGMEGCKVATRKAEENAGG